MQNGKELGRMKKIKLREIWKDEAGDFTPWLAEEENLALLGDTIGLELELEGRETSVGDFRADIMARNTADGTVVLIENQLKRTDHVHLGQLMAYTAGLEAATVVWIALRFTDEHMAALDWLNENTDDQFSFFGLEVELWRIGNSIPAPKFNIVSKPNDWSREARVGAQKELSETDKFRLNYWKHFRKYMEDQNTKLKLPKPNKLHYMTFSIGRSDFKLVTVIRFQNPKRIQCQFEAWRDYSGPMFRYLEENKLEIEKEFGASLDFKKTKKGGGMSLSVFLHTDPQNKNEAEREKQFKWFEDNLMKFDRIFRPLVKDFNPDEWEEYEEDEIE